jgi:uncharacterized membrane protein
LFGVYTGIVLEGTEIPVPTIALGASTDAFRLSLLGLLIGWAILLGWARVLKPLMEKIPEWALQTGIGLIMMIIATSLMIIHE